MNKTLHIHFDINSSYVIVIYVCVWRFPCVYVWKCARGVKIKLENTLLPLSISKLKCILTSTKKVSTQADRIIKFVLNFLSSHSFRISYQSNKTVSVYTNQRSWLVFNNVNTDNFYEDDRTNSLKKCIFFTCIFM